MNDTSTNQQFVDRRTLLTAVAAGTAGIAGCLGDDNGDDDPGADGTDAEAGEAGERVPPLIFSWPTGLGATSDGLEEATRLGMDDIEEHLGVECEAEPKEILTQYEDVYNDNRTHHFMFDGQLSVPSYLDPQPMLQEAHIMWAGANGAGNRSNYANCEYSELASEARRTSDEEERRDLVNQALSIASADIERINNRDSITRYAFNSDQLQFGELGEGGMTSRNIYFFYNTEPQGDNDALIMNETASAVENSTHMAMEDTQALIYWSNLVYQPLVRFDGDYEIEPALAEDYEIEDDATRFTFYLRDDATFHDGEPVTAEDVKWTYEFMEENRALYPDVTGWGYESIEVIDDHTVEIVLPEPAAPFLRTHVALWGILPEHVWVEGGAEENPDNVDLDPIVGCGPFQVQDFRQGEILQLEPYEDFWDPVDHRVIFEVYADIQGAYRAFQEGEINVIRNPSASMHQQLDEDMPEAEIRVVNEFLDQWLIPSNNFGPTQFREFKLAVSHALDRGLQNEATTHGDGIEAEYSCLFNPVHPFFPDDPDDVLTRISESPESDPDSARAVLEEEGWTWDDDGYLRYPEDIDLSPMWPEGDEPADHPDEFPCVEDLSA